MQTQRPHTPALCPDGIARPTLPHPRSAEVDSDADIAAGRAPGAKRAAVRKLGHELGIPAQQLPLDKLKYLTRLHYCAADTGGAQELGVGWGRGGGLV